ncbi:MAG: coenzyme F420-0:L-glutamate ligase [Chloroflexota bacterium]
MANAPSFQIYALQGVPMVQEDDDLVAIIRDALTASGFELVDGDIIVMASKIVSKAQGRLVALEDVVAGEEAVQVAAEVGKDPRVVELILSESRGISRMRRGVLITEHVQGFVSANSGVDASNVGEKDSVLLLPKKPDEVAQRIRIRLKHLTGADVAIVITDTHGRPFRLGNIGVALGVAGMEALWDRRGETDLFGREMIATVMGYGDMVASAAHLVMGEGAEGLPLVLIRGLAFPKGDGKASDLNRPPEMDMYR